MNNPNKIIDPMLPTTLPGDDTQPDFESMNRAALLTWEEWHDAPHVSPTHGQRRTARSTQCTITTAEVTESTSQWWQ
eukprot:9125968-Ditylum_brightwellii.AAC.1